MADRNQLKKAVPSNQIDEDPFAELTRIMGFDPRVPVGRSQPAAVEKLAALAAEENDLSINLEKELMGEFASLDDEAEARYQVAAKPLSQPEPAPEVPEEDTLTEDYDFVFDADLASDEYDPAIAAAAEKALADELDAAFATKPILDESGAEETHADAVAGEIPVDEPVVAIEAAADEPLTAEFETAFAGETAAEEPATPVAAVEEGALVDELEAALAEETVAEERDAASDAIDEEIVPDDVDEAFATHLQDHLEDHLAGDAAEPAAVEPEMIAEPEPEMIAEPEFAEVTEAEIRASGEETAEPIAETYDADDDVPLIPLGAARDFARTGEPLASVDADFHTEVVGEMTQSSDELSAQADEPEDDYDLEAELSALLGKGTAAASKAAVAPAVDAEAPDEPTLSVAEPVGEPVASLDDDWTVDGEDPLPLAAETADSEPVAEPEAYGSRTELQPEEPVMASEEGRADASEQDDYDQPELDVPTYASAAEEPHQDDALYQDEDDPLSEFVVEQELQAELAALDGDIDFSADDLALTDEQPAYAAAGEDEHASDGPVAADEPAIETTAKDEIGSAEMTDDPVDEQPAITASVAPAPTQKMPEPLQVEEEEDPFAMLAAMVRGTQPVTQPAPFTASARMSYQDLPRSDAPTANESPAVPTTEYQYQNRSYANRAPVGAPDIETVDVPESAVALADDLDIPDLAFEDDLPLAADFDDFEAELASAFNQQASTPAQPPAEPVHAAPRDSYQHEYAHYQQPAPVAPSYLGGAAAATAAATPAYAAPQPAASLDNDYYPDSDDGLAGERAPFAHQAVDEDDLAYDPELNEEMAVPAYQGVGEPQSSNRRGLLIAAIVGGVVLVGGIGAFALSGGGNGTDAPALVRADTDPVKIRPENPGGTTVPNQDNKVFQTMNGTDTAAAAPTQEKLISGTEEPVDVAARAEPRAITPQSAEEGEEAIEGAPLMADEEPATAEDPIAAEIAAAPKGEERVAPAAEEPTASSETVAVAPRRVRTMVVRADGTLVPSEEPAPAAEPQAGDTTASTLEPADPAKSLADPVAPESTGSLTPSAAPAETAAASKPAATANQSGMPASGPVAPSRPADQPVDVVGEVKPQQVAAASSAVAAGAWSMQIASQPSEAAAQSSYEDLARRYGSVIGGRGVNIVKADIAGKGTFWRVRVPAGSRNEAISLCESYKAAGGNCFVSK